MEKRGTSALLKVSISLVLLVVIVHLLAHFMVYGTGIPFLGEKGISGLSIGPLEVNEDELLDFKSANPGFASLSKYIILGEWGLLILLVVLTFAGDRINLKKEVMTLKEKEEYRKSENQTDLDTLYEILKEKKSLRLSTISKLFSIDKELVMQWIDTLESGNLASISYPRFGEPEVKLIEKGKNER